MAKLVNLSKISSATDEPEKIETVLFDSGANVCVTNRKDDFGEFHKMCDNDIIDGIGKAPRIEGVGVVAWTFKADNGMC